MARSSDGDKGCGGGWVGLKPAPGQQGALGPVVISRCEAEMVNFPCPNRRNKGLKPLVLHEIVTVESGF